MFHELLIDKRRYLTAAASERRYLAAAASRRSCSAMPGAFIFGGQRLWDSDPLIAINE